MNLGYVIDIGGTNIRFGVANNEIEFQNPFFSCKTPKEREKILETIYLGIQTLEKGYPNTKRQIAISCPGLIFKGYVKKALYIDLEGINLKKALEKSFDYNIIIENDANFQAIGRYNNKNLLYMNIGTAVGGAYIDCNGVLLGSNGHACEFGHMFTGGSEQCYCGKFGCLDTVVSGKRLIELFDVEWWKRKDDEIEEYLRYAGNIVAEVIDNLSVVFDPGEICICGNICSKKSFRNSIESKWSQSKWKRCDIDFLTNTWPLVVRASTLLLAN